MKEESVTQDLHAPAEQTIQGVAKALSEANYLLILAGAGFSADSGLDTYESMPEEYRELCDPAILVRQEKRFQEFWWQFAKKYAETAPHKGYNILDSWCEGGKLKNLMMHDHGNLCSWWVYTSNVDGHFRRFSSFESSLCEIHGFAGEFRCGGAMGYENGVERIGDMWKNWNQRVHELHTDKCDNDSLVEVGNEEKQSFRCMHCGLPSRPNVLMFHDTDANVLRSIGEQRERYQNWESRMEDDVVNCEKNLVILEFGCGKNVPAVRYESEEVLGDCIERIRSSPKGGDVTLVRVNPKDAGIDCNADIKSHVVSLYDSSLRALHSIDRELSMLLKEHIAG